MRQRIKLAQALAHHPDVVVLDEPLNGMDPMGRHQTIELVKALGGSGKTVLVSSHILHEVEAMTSTVVLLYQGRVRADGTKEEIRGFLSDYPHRIRIRSPRARELAAVLLALDGTVGLRLDDGAVTLETRDPGQVYDRLPRCVLDEGLGVDALEAQDVGLDAIFEYLVK
jgi:ABC-2 type transport system ATP-binding protein